MDISSPRSLGGSSQLSTSLRLLPTLLPGSLFDADPGTNDTSISAAESAVVLCSPAEAGPLDVPPLLYVCVCESE